MPLNRSIELSGTQARQWIAQIDRLIDANRDDMQRVARKRPRSAGGWQALWDRFPEHYAREQALGSMRGAIQVRRDNADEKEWQREQAKERARYRAPSYQQCPTCNCNTLRNAA